MVAEEVPLRLIGPPLVKTRAKRCWAPWRDSPSTAPIVDHECPRSRARATPSARAASAPVARSRAAITSSSAIGSGRSLPTMPLPTAERRRSQLEHRAIGP
jgi:hypothetical protein